MSLSRLFGAVAISYAERLAAFAMPLLMLRGTDGPQAFVRVEYIISISIIAATFFDLGLRNYVMYHFRLERDVGRTTLRSVQAFVIVFAAQLVLLATTIASVELLVPSGSPHTDLALGVVRGMALAIIGLVTQICILHDRPLNGILLSLLTWLMSGLVFLLPSDSSVDMRIVTFFLSAILLVAATPVVLWRLTGLRPQREGMDYLVQSLNWGWPLLLGAAASIAVAHLSRIFAFSNFDLKSAVAFAFWMRIFSIIQLNHKASIVVISRRIFISNDKYVTNSTLRSYQILMIPSIIFSFGSAALAGNFNEFFKINIPLLSFSSSAFIGLHVTFWCFAAFLEIYFVREARTKEVLVAAIIPAAAFLMFLFLYPNLNVAQTTFAMAVSSFMQFAILFFRLRASNVSR